VANGDFFARCHVGWLISVSTYRLGLQTMCYSRHILQVSLDKNAAHDVPTKARHFRWKWQACT